MSLPIDQHATEIIAALASNRPLVLKAPPGAGKTTGVPPMMMNMSGLPKGQIWLIQPRRLAARTAAARIAKTMGVPLGNEVGYHVRHDLRATDQSRVIVMTTGIAIQRLRSDPLAEHVAAILIDEFHERSIDMDMVLAMSLQLRRTLRDDLRLVVMSATLDPGPIADHLGEAAVSITSEGRAYPVTIEYRGTIDWKTRRQNSQIAAAVRTAAANDSGDVLVFLPGAGEIRGVHRELASDGLDVRMLYGTMSPADQDRSLSKSDRQRIFLATNIAETSLTIDGVTTVVDSGKSRVMRFDPVVGLPRLELSDISVASADQRGGRGGRTRAGNAIRLWPADRHRFRKPEDAPEIEIGDLAPMVMSILAWDNVDPMTLPWLTPPPKTSIDAAFEMLAMLGAVDDDHRITQAGEKMAAMPVHPRIAAMVATAIEFGIARSAIAAAVVMTIRTSNHDVSLLDRMEAFRGGQIDPPSRQMFDREVKDLIRRSDAPADRSPDRSPENWRAAVVRCVLAGFADRLCRRRDDDRLAAVMAGGRGVRLAGPLAGDDELFVALDVDDSMPEARVRLAIAVPRDCIDDSMWTTETVHRWHAAGARVQSRGVRRIGSLIIDQWPEKTLPCDPVANILARNSLNHSESLMPPNGRASDLLRRWRWLTTIDPDLLAAPPDELDFEHWTRLFAAEKTSLQEIRQAPWFDYLIGHLGYGHSRRLDELAPVQIVVPGGRTAPIVYPNEGDLNRPPPRVEARIGELFGWLQTPRIAGGRVALQLHMLSPAGRIEQITDDLEHFWNVTYTRVRKDLRGRYPKHHWPDDPLTAVATHNGMKPRRPT